MKFIMEDRGQVNLKSMDFYHLEECDLPFKRGKTKVIQQLENLEGGNQKHNGMEERGFNEREWNDRQCHTGTRSLWTREIPKTKAKNIKKQTNKKEKESERE
jgi:hypothetical protein